MNAELSLLANEIDEFCQQSSQHELKYLSMLEKNQSTIIDELGGLQQIVYICLTHHNASNMINQTKLSTLTQFVQTNHNDRCGNNYNFASQTKQRIITI